MPVNDSLALFPVQSVANTRQALNSGFNSIMKADENKRQNRLLEMKAAQMQNDNQFRQQQAQSQAGHQNALLDLKRSALAADQKRQQFEMDATTGAMLHKAFSGLGNLDPETRAAQIELMKPKLMQHGFDDDDWQQLATDDGIAMAAQHFAQYVPVSPNAKTADPSSVREYQYFNSLTPEAKREYLTMKRANQTVKMGDVSGTVGQLDNSFNPISERPGATQEDLQTTISDQQALKEAKGDAAKLAIKKSEEAFDKIAPIRKGISNYDEVIRLVDEGADTGVIASRFPSMKQSSIELDTLQGELGLDVIGNTTFGALSEAELKFALDTALPKKLEGQALKAWVQRKKAAQEKLLAYTQEAATYLGTPGNTVSGWLTLQKERALDKVPQQALELLKSDPSLKDSFYEKYGVLPDGY